MLPPQGSISANEVEKLAAALRRKVEGEIRFDAGSRALYASDLSVYRQVPIGVVIPRSINDVVATVAVCHERNVPILGRGCGTSLAGQCCNVAVVIDFSKYLNRLIELNPRQRYAWVEPGLINDHLRNAAEEYHLTLAPDPATHEYCTLGGMIGNNSCGAHSVMGGKTALDRKALLHGHCHQKALFGMKAEQQLLSRMGLEVELLDSGCCGLAGSFGYEEGHYDVSMKIGERILLPRVRSAGRDTLIITDGFSCREQIMHGTPRHALHFAEIIQMGLHQPPLAKTKYAETGFFEEPPRYPALTAATGLGLLAAGGLFLLQKNKPQP